MTRISVITPTRSRPESCMEMIDAIRSTSYYDIEVVLGIDLDDPKFDEYMKIENGSGTRVVRYIGDRRSLSSWTNYISKIEMDHVDFLVSMGDDHRPRTKNWDLELIKAIKLLSGPGFAYGDDGMNGSGLCTMWMVSSEVVQALGWMMVPTCDHMYVDNAIMELGMKSDRLVYCPSVSVEHLHHSAGKSEMDNTYKQTNNKKQYDRDLGAFRRWRYSTQFEEDVRTVRNLTYV